MIQVAPQMRILVVCKAVDFRKGIDGLCGICRNVLEVDPFSGYLFVFRNKGGSAIKVLVYDGQGFWLCQKRLSKGRFSWWNTLENSTVKHIAAHEMQMLLWNGTVHTNISPLWKKVPRHKI